MKWVTYLVPFVSVNSWEIKQSTKHTFEFVGQHSDERTDKITVGKWTAFIKDKNRDIWDAARFDYFCTFFLPTQRMGK